MYHELSIYPELEGTILPLPVLQHQYSEVDQKTCQIGQGHRRRIAPRRSYSRFERRALHSMNNRDRQSQESSV
jgi:hypothetical protein